MLALIIATVASAEDDGTRPFVLLPDYLAMVSETAPVYEEQVDPALVARPCTVLAELKGGAVVAIRGDGCNQAVRAPIEEALAEWQFTSKTADPADGLLALLVQHVQKRKGLEATITPVWAVSPQNRVPPAYPEIQKGDPKTAECRVAVQVDALGTQDGLSVTECPDAYAASVTLAVGQWQWYPLVVDKKPTGFRTVLRIQFVRK